MAKSQRKTAKRARRTFTLDFMQQAVQMMVDAYLRNGPWGDIFNTEDAANALAASWGFPQTGKFPWVGL